MHYDNNGQLCYCVWGDFKSNTRSGEAMLINNPQPVMPYYLVMKTRCIVLTQWMVKIDIWEERDLQLNTKEQKLYGGGRSQWSYK